MHAHPLGMRTVCVDRLVWRLYPQKPHGGIRRQYKRAFETLNMHRDPALQCLRQKNLSSAVPVGWQ